MKSFNEELKCADITDERFVKSLTEYLCKIMCEVREEKATSKIKLKLE